MSVLGESAALLDTERKWWEENRQSVAPSDECMVSGALMHELLSARDELAWLKKTVGQSTELRFGKAESLDGAS